MPKTHYIPLPRKGFIVRIGAFGIGMRWRRCWIALEWRGRIFFDSQPWFRKPTINPSWYHLA